LARRREVSSIALAIDGVIVSAYMCTWPETLRAGAADRLDERPAGAQEALLVGVEDRHQRHLGQVEALAEQVDADEHVVVALPQLLEQLDAPDRVDLAVQVATRMPSSSR
jgi:hypothetical protein